MSSLASAAVMNTCIDAEGKKITTDQPCEKVSGKDPNGTDVAAVDTAMATAASAMQLTTSTPASTTGNAVAADNANAAASMATESNAPFLLPPMPKVVVEHKIPPAPPPNQWMELIHDDYSILIMIGACPFLFAFFWYIFEYRLRRS